MESLTPQAHQVTHNVHGSATLSSQCICLTHVCPVQQSMLPWLGEFILKNSYNNQRGTCMIDNHEPTLALTSFWKVIKRVGWMYLANRCMRECILPKDACNNASCQMMHVGIHIAIKWIGEHIPPTDILPTDACRNTYHQQMHVGMHITNRWVRERIPPIDAYRNASHKQARRGKHFTNRYMWEHITPTNRCVWECILPTDACWNISHHEDCKD